MRSRWSLIEGLNDAKWQAECLKRTVETKRKDMAELESQLQKEKEAMSDRKSVV